MTADHEPRDDLSAFLREQMHERDISYRRLAEEAVDPETGHALGFQWLARLAGMQLAKAPEAWQLRALAAALHADPEKVKGLAARQWLEFEVAQITLGAPREWVLYLQQVNMSDKDRAELRDLVTDFVRRQEARRGGADAGTGEAGA